MSDTATPEQAVKAAKTATATEYVILEERQMTPGLGDDDVDVTSFGAPWEKRKTVKARSADEAIKAYGQAGTFVAIPLRSWRPVRVTEKVETTLELKPAS